MEGKTTAKPNRKSGPETRKRIIIKKNPPDCDSDVGRGKSEMDKQKGWGSENTFIGFILSKEGNTSFLYTWHGRKKIKTISKWLLIICNTDIEQTPTKTNLSKICVTRM